MIAGAVAFGMVLASDLQLTAPILAKDSGPIVPKAAASTVQLGLPSFADLAEAVEPAVVSIKASTIQNAARQREGGQRRPNPFEDFFRDRGFGAPQPEPDQDRREESGGSGFIISADGLVVTNVHVVEGADKVTVKIGDREYPAEVKGKDSATDLALLKIDAGHDLPYLALGDSEKLRSGDWVMAVGDPLGLENTVTTGVVSAKGRAIGLSRDTSFENYIQTDAAINFGNSGGPLLNLAGEVVGINAAIRYGAENIGFAIPVNVLKGVLPQLRDTGKVRRGYLGVSIGNVDHDTAEAFGLDRAEGALVNSVLEGEPAEKAGVQHGDIILTVDGRPVKTTRDLIDYVSAQAPDATVKLGILRGDDRIEKAVKLTERRSGEPTAEIEEAESDEGSIEWLGLRYQNLTPALREAQGLPQDAAGVWLSSIAATSPLWEEGVREGAGSWLINEVNGQKVEDVESFEAAVKAAKPGSRLRLYALHYSQGERDFAGFVLPRVPAD
jgi:serine protease Do